MKLDCRKMNKSNLNDYFKSKLNKKLDSNWRLSGRKFKFKNTIYYKCSKAIGSGENKCKSRCSIKINNKTKMVDVFWNQIGHNHPL